MRTEKLNRQDAKAPRRGSSNAPASVPESIQTMARFARYSFTASILASPLKLQHMNLGVLPRI
jgi:cellulose synthase/poly-beta-1,6-N-acetylglucosamine synthase-like glycosyltransferase